MRGEVIYKSGKRVASTEYRSWQMMKNRCLNTNAKDYKYYGGRGITIQPEWYEFDAFLSDMGRKPNPAYTLDRIDSNGNYNKANCRWVSRKEQARNRAYAKTKSWELAEILGIKPESAAHYIWQYKAKERGRIDGIWITPELEEKIKTHLEKLK